MPEDPSIAVTGATGRLGGKVAALLAEAGWPQRLVVRRPEQAPRLPLATVATASYDDGPAARRALDGVETVFMVSARESADRVAQHATLIAAAVDAGVQHIVYTSFYGAAPDAVFTFARDHFATLLHLRH